MGVRRSPIATSAPLVQVKVTRPENLKYSVPLRLAEGDRDTVLCQDSLVFVLDLDKASKGLLEPIHPSSSLTSTGSYPIIDLRDGGRGYRSMMSGITSR